MTGPAVRVQVLGGLSIWAGDVPLLENPALPDVHWQLFCIALLCPDLAADRRKLVRALWPEKAPKNIKKSLENATGALRLAFEQAHFPEAPLVSTGPGYAVNPAIHFDVDLWRFEAALAQEPTTTADGEDPLALYPEALELYAGALLPQLATAPWAAALAAQARRLFIYAAHTLCAALLAAQRHSQLLEVATAATAAQPDEEGLYVYVFRALAGLGMPRAIIPAYHRTTRLFSEFFGRKPGWEIPDIYQTACAQVDPAEQDILVITGDLRLATQEHTADGPLYCTYEVFRYLCQMAGRTARRSGGSVGLLLVQLRALPGGPPPLARQLAAAMHQLKNLLSGELLRKSDTFTRYSPHQFLIMLSVDKPLGVELVTRRIESACRPFLAPMGMALGFSTAFLETPG
ncbi:MAG: BTAD domain-containing putative transcriptional regulator [Oscillospiraceae bacterium]